MSSHDQVALYYDYTLPFYKRFWHGSTHGLHYGYWGSGARTLRQAIVAMNQLVSTLGKIQKTDRVLDAGCGIGGSAMWIAKTYGATVTGVTLSERQAEVAGRLITDQGLGTQVSVQVADYFNVPFPNRSFSVVWGLESICYAHQRIDEFAQEMYRVLEPGGRLILADGFVGACSTPRHTRLLKIFEDGFALPGLITPHEFTAALERAGFRNIRSADITPHIIPTAKRMWLMCVLTYPFAWLGEKLGVTSPILTKNNHTGIVQKELFESRALVYCTIYAEK